MASAPPRPDRSRAPAPAERELEALKAAIRALAGGGPAPGMDRFDSETAGALRALARVPSDDPAGSHRGGALPAPLSGARADRVLVVAKLERYRALRSRGGEALATQLLSILRRRIEKAATRVQIRRCGHGVVEFLLELAPEADAEAALWNLHSHLEQPFRCEGETFASVVVFGAAPAPEGAEVAEVVSQAEQALAHAEAQGVRLSIYCERQRQDASARLALMHDLRAAVRADALTVAYQPKLNLRTGRIDSVEALLRWTHPIRGEVPPDRFIGLAEDTGDIERLTESVLRMAIRDQAAMARLGPPPTIYVNLSGRLVTSEAFCARAIDIRRGAVGRIGMEITETAVISHPDVALRNLRAFAKAGIGISIDDYGSGLSSLAYLKMLPADELKIDKTFILGLTSSHRDPLIVRSTIDLAHALEMEVTAEGVDDPTALALLQVMGCDRVQGFHISRPLPLAELLPLLAAPVRSDLLTRGGRGLLSAAR